MDIESVIFQFRFLEDTLLFLQFVLFCPEIQAAFFPFINKIPGPFDDFIGACEGCDDIAALLWNIGRFWG